MKSKRMRPSNVFPCLVLHPYFKLDYIAKAWGGLEEQMQEMAGGNRRAKNWRAEAERIVKDTVSFDCIIVDLSLTVRLDGALLGTQSCIESRQPIPLVHCPFLSADRLCYHLKAYRDQWMRIGRRIIRRIRPISTSLDRIGGRRRRRLEYGVCSICERYCERRQ